MTLLPPPVFENICNLQMNRSSMTGKQMIILLHFLYCMCTNQVLDDTLE